MGTCHVRATVYVRVSGLSMRRLNKPAQRYGKSPSRAPNHSRCPHSFLPTLNPSSCLPMPAGLARLSCAKGVLLDSRRTHRGGFGARQQFDGRKEGRGMIFGKRTAPLVTIRQENEILLCCSGS